MLLDRRERLHPVGALADDLDVSEMQYLPTVRKLIGDEGVTLDNEYVSNSLCCPSRATMLRGQYAHKHLRDNLLEF